MENKISPELLEKAKTASTPEALIALAKENSIALTEEEAKAYFDQLHPKTGELSDEELDNVAGGACHIKDGRMVVAAGCECDYFICKKDGSGWFRNRRTGSRFCRTCRTMIGCTKCRYCSYEKGLWLCNHPDNRK